MKTLLIAIAEWLELKMPGTWRYYLLRRWLIVEMRAAGWKQDPEGAKRLVRDEFTTFEFRRNLADHEAAALHLKAYPLR